MIAANSCSSCVSCGRAFDGKISGSAISHNPSGKILVHGYLPSFSGQRARSR